MVVPAKNRHVDISGNRCGAEISPGPRRERQGTIYGHADTEKLDATFAAFQDRIRGCVQLLGILVTPSRATRPASVLPPETLFLVLEFATEGPLLDYLNRTLTGNQSDWPIIIQLISDMTSALEELHERGIIHRYYSLP
jgi:serine/threonine protein kinase